MMEDLIKQRLELESSIGDQHSSVWNEFVEPFFEAKHKELYQLFLETESKNINGLQTIRLQSNVLESMKIHFAHYMNTGELAKNQLKNEGES